MADQGQRPGWASRTLEKALVAWYRANGWRAVCERPVPKKAVIIAAPHTSNWDFVYYIGLTRDLGVETSFMAKRELFNWPLGGFMRDMGGVPVDRKKGGNYVEAMIAEFARRDEFLLTIAPEGTRSASGHWRTGFYHIALGAGVPMILGMMDYPKKLGGLGPAIMPTGDYAADMARLQTYYADVTPRHPEKAARTIIAP